VRPIAIGLALVAPHLLASAQADPADDAAAVRAGLDHVVVAVNDLEAAAQSYSDLGFALKPGRPHANGIENRHVKFADGIEIELLTAPAARDGLTDRYRRHLEAGDGPAYFVLYAADRDAASRRLSSAGVAHVRDGGLITFPEAHPLGAMFFSGRNHSPTDRPEHFAHANTAETLVALWLAGDLAAEKELLGLFGGTSTSATVRVPAPVRAEVVAIEDALVYLLPPAHQLQPGRKVVGVTVRVRSLESARAALALAGRDAPIEAEGSLFVPPSAAHGLWIELREERRADSGAPVTPQ
jgi:catechol 2,3-dioxygenase-like lactoylglutathione lyase family enzyme